MLLKTTLKILLHMQHMISLSRRKMKCQRCDGLLILDQVDRSWEDFESFTCYRCLNCGNVAEKGIFINKQAQNGKTTSENKIRRGRGKYHTLKYPKRKKGEKHVD